MALDKMVHLVRCLFSFQATLLNRKNMTQERDALDFGAMNIPRLFVKLFIPTLLGLIFSALLNLADGMFVGHGVGSDALAAINVAAPIFQICTGIAMMFGAGVSVVAAVHLSRGNVKAANINVTQAITVGVLLMALVSAVILCFPEAACRLFGGSDRLMPYVVDYLHFVAPGMPFFIILIEGMFILRLDGSPKFAMGTNIFAALLNVFLDWLFVFPLGWGVKGAAFATALSQLTGACVILVYLLFFRRRLRFYRLKLSRTSLRLTLRNVGYMGRLGFSTLLGELAISFMMVVGNYAFIARLHEDGVAAYSIVCYLFPLIFMFGQAIAQSALPIMSYNYGAHNVDRVRSTARLAMTSAAVMGLMMVLVLMFLAGPVVGIFLDSGAPASHLAVAGLPKFALGVVFFTLNLVAIGLYQSVERAKVATVFMVLRGFVFVLIAFVLLPRLLGDTGLWLAIPASELCAFLVIAGYQVRRL